MLIEIGSQCSETFVPLFSIAEERKPGRRTATGEEEKAKLKGRRRNKEEI